jgi:abequosyltransferase
LREEEHRYNQPMRLLTVAIPTFERAQLLDDQLRWFAGAVAGHEHLVEFVVSDNHSSDGTPEVVERWRRTLTHPDLVTHWRRNEQNVGAIRNIASCITRATGQYVWTIGDDDEIAPETLGYVLDTLRSRPELALLVLNYSSRNYKTRALRFARCFDVANDEYSDPGSPIIDRFLRDPDPSRWGGLALTTALVYRSDVAREALATWPTGLDNITVQLYVTAFLARHGATMLTRDAHLEMISGRHFFDGDPELRLRFRYADVPEAFVRIAELGYSVDMCRERIRYQRKEITMRRIAKMLVRHPLSTLHVVARHWLASSRLALHRPT